MKIQEVRRSLVALLLSLPIFLPVAAKAADQVVLRYGPIEGRISVADLEVLGATGEAPPGLATYLRRANQEPASVQRVLTREVEVNHVTLDRVLNNPVGEIALDQIGDVIQTPAGGANRQALRAALVLAASDDGKLSLLETIRKYPTSEVYVDGPKLLSAYQAISRVEKQARKVTDVLDIFF